MMGHGGSTGGTEHGERIDGPGPMRPTFRVGTYTAPTQGFVRRPWTSRVRRTADAVPEDTAIAPAAYVNPCELRQEPEPGAKLLNGNDRAWLDTLDPADAERR